MKTSVKLQQCSLTVLDTTAPDITFDEQGVCNYVHEFRRNFSGRMAMPAEERDKRFLEKIAAIKKAGKGKPYDCILGLSGGVDSSYMAYIAWKYELRPLAIHFDNGWNSELAVKNIEGIVNTCGYDLHTYVIDWEEFRDLQIAYLKASVVDIEVPTDHFIFATLYEYAAKFKIPYILNGNNFQTEAIMPRGWNYKKTDLDNILDIHKKYGTIPLKKYPKLGRLQLYYYHNVRNITQIYLLEFLDYKKAEAKEIIKREFGWRDYGGKHYESIWTKFYQAYILPEKFNIDKRKAHLSNLILTDQITREEALAELEKPLYNELDLMDEKEYVLKKLGLSEADFFQIMQNPPVPHTHYDTEANHKQRYERIEKNMLTIPKRAYYKMLRILKIW